MLKVSIISSAYIRIAIDPSSSISTPATRVSAVFPIASATNPEMIMNTKEILNRACISIGVNMAPGSAQLTTLPPPYEYVFDIIAT